MDSCLKPGQSSDRKRRDLVAETSGTSKVAWHWRSKNVLCEFKVGGSKCFSERTLYLLFRFPGQSLIISSADFKPCKASSNGVIACDCYKEWSAMALFMMLFAFELQQQKISTTVKWYQCVEVFIDRVGRCLSCLAFWQPIESQ